MPPFARSDFALISLVASTYAAGTRRLPLGDHSVSASLSPPVIWPSLPAFWLALKPCHIPTTAQTTTFAFPDARLATVDNRTYFSALITLLISKSLRMCNPLAYEWGCEIILLSLCHLFPPSSKGLFQHAGLITIAGGRDWGGKRRKTITMLMLEATPD